MAGCLPRRQRDRRRRPNFLELGGSGGGADRPPYTSSAKMARETKKGTRKQKTKKDVRDQATEPVVQAAAVPGRDLKGLLCAWFMNTIRTLWAWSWLLSVFFAIVIALTLGSYSLNDPSFSVSTGRTPEHFCGALGLRLFRLVVCARQRDDRLLRDPHGLAPHEGRDGSSSHQSSQDHGRRRLSGGARGLDLPRGPASSPLPDDPSGRAGRHPRRQPRLGHPPLHRRRTLHGAFRLAHCSRPFASDGLPVGRRRGAHRPLHLLLVHRSRGPSPPDQAPRGGARDRGHGCEHRADRARGR